MQVQVILSSITMRPLFLINVTAQILFLGQKPLTEVSNYISTAASAVSFEKSELLRPS
jgi:hypothetical protein